MSLLTLFIPAPINIYITRNTFVRFISNDGINEDVGLIVNISLEQNMLAVRRFMSWAQVLTLVGDRMIPNISCWPLNIQNNPLFLCDTDVTADVSIQRVRGLAFVFYFDDPFVQHIQGMANTYLVSSILTALNVLSATKGHFFISFIICRE